MTTAATSAFAPVLEAMNKLAAGGGIGSGGGSTTNNTTNIDRMELSIPGMGVPMTSTQVRRLLGDLNRESKNGKIRGFEGRGLR